ncbi:MAG TPA: bifunctional 4-hydroxy-2-oxoglutarate aldolase/2-dehydro-3-deoxy-phosphogluconate aldolase [Candidatus Acidoferrum sp.]|nr:bifunctional 4-hydroxy-2-oxoglutarate aldolase/2-dehydro-3-deoxy-phosphogluconate aldolase [Candidatus Acidoferrum sp.]
MDKQETRARVEEVGIVPVIRAASPDEARFAAEAVQQGGISIIEITMTVPGAIELIRELTRAMPQLLVGAGTVLDAESAGRCLDAGARFLVSPGLDLPTVAFAKKQGVLMMAGALTPTEVITAWRAGSDLVKIFPCSQVGGASYIKALKGPLPQIPLVPTGGVNLATAADFIRAGSAALGVGGELILKEAVKARKPEAITETARKLVEIVRQTRVETAETSARG